MAFGLTPKFEQSLDLNGINPEHYLVIALDAAKQLEWDINYSSKSGFVSTVGGGLFSSTERFTVVIKDDTVILKSENVGGGLYDWGKNQKHVEAFISTFDILKTSLSEAELEAKVNDVMPPLRAYEEDIHAAPPETAAQKFKGFLSLFTPRDGYYITPIIININIIIFILMTISGISVFEPSSASLVTWGANIGGLTLAGEWWRLITSTFLHIGIFHIAFNMFALLYIGVLLEPYLGKLRFATTYLLTGLAASLTSISMHPNTISAGASGAIFGMYGVFLALLTTNIIDKKTRSALLTSIGVFVAYNLMNGMKAGIDNAAHMGGLVTGLIIGYAYYPSLKKPSSKIIEYISVGALTIIVLTASIIVYNRIPNDVGKYEAKMNAFAKHEALALEVFDMKGASDSAILSAFKDKGLPNWNANLQILDEASKLDVPLDLVYRDALLRDYCKMRIKSYKIICRAIGEKTDKYNSSIDSCNNQIKSMLDSLKK